MLSKGHQFARMASAQTSRRDTCANVMTDTTEKTKMSALVNISVSKLIAVLLFVDARN